MDTVLSRAQCREVDRRAIEEYGICSLVLMENAGRGCADVLCRLHAAGPVVIVCGKGNNGGDGLVIGRHLEIRGIAARVLLLGPACDLTGDAAANAAIVQHTDVPLYELTGGDAEHVDAWLTRHGSGGEWLVDAMLGTGATGRPRPPYAAAIEWFNRQTARKLAVDVPSGLDCDTGAAPGPTIRADVTCTFVATKPGFATSAARVYTGEIHVLDIGAPRKLVESIG